jgi:predicted  nucleic acid-binding Zn-ribbon protein
MLKGQDRDVLVDMYARRHEEISDYRQAQNALKQGVVSQHKQIQDLKTRLERAEARCQDLGDQLSQAETSLRNWTAYGLARHREACVTRTMLFQEMTENANLGALLRKHWNELVWHSDALVQTIERSMLLEQVIADKDQMIRFYISELQKTQDVRRQMQT